MKNIIAIVFDFDETLAKDSTTSLLESIGIDTNLFWKKEVQDLLNFGWDPVPAYLFKMIEYSKDGHKITLDLFRKHAKSIKFFKGVTNLFGTLKKHVQYKNDIELEFYIISSGIGEILRNTRISKHFTDIWACDFHYNENNEITFPKNIVSFTDKTRYLFHISKGLVGEKYKNKPFDVNKKFEKNEFRVPSNHIIFIGDGYTDIPCFSLVKKMEGIPIAVYDNQNENKWGTAWDFLEQDRVINLVPADYSRNSALMNSLKMAIDSIIKKIELSEKVYQG
jgi:hydroxymethylpyrimidine pyrophosphatase-like HAD family hydrolase